MNGFAMGRHLCLTIKLLNEFFVDLFQETIHQSGLCDIRYSFSLLRLPLPASTAYTLMNTSPLGEGTVYLKQNFDEIYLTKVH